MCGVCSLGFISGFSVCFVIGVMGFGILVFSFC